MPYMEIKRNKNIKTGRQQWKKKIVEKRSTVK